MCSSSNQGVKIIASFEERAVSFCTSGDTDQSGKASRSANEEIRPLATFVDSVEAVFKQLHHKTN